MELDEHLGAQWFLQQAVWIIDGLHIGFGWFVVLQLLIALFLIVIQFTINDAETPQK